MRTLQADGRAKAEKRVSTAREHKCIRPLGPAHTTRDHPAATATTRESSSESQPAVVATVKTTARTAKACCSKPQTASSSSASDASSEAAVSPPAHQPTNHVPALWPEAKFPGFKLAQAYPPPEPGTPALAANPAKRVLPPRGSSAKAQATRAAPPPAKSSQRAPLATAAPQTSGTQTQLRRSQSSASAALPPRPWNFGSTGASKRGPQQASKVSDSTPVPLPKSGSEGRMRTRPSLASQASISMLKAEPGPMQGRRSVSSSASAGKSVPLNRQSSRPRVWAP